MQPGAARPAEDAWWLTGTPRNVRFLLREKLPGCSEGLLQPDINNPHDLFVLSVLAREFAPGVDTFRKPERSASLSYGWMVAFAWLVLMLVILLLVSPLRHVLVASVWAAAVLLVGVLVRWLCEMA